MERTNVVRDALAVVVYDDDQVLLQGAGVVDGLEGHPTSKGSITNHRDDLVCRAAQVACDGHAERGRDRRTGMAGAKRVIRTFVPPQVAGQPVELFYRAEAVEPTCHQLVRIRLVADVPDKLVVGRIEGDVKGQGQFDHTQVGRQVPATLRHSRDDFLTHLLRELDEFGRRMFAQVGRARNAVQNSWHGQLLDAPILSSVTRESQAPALGLTEDCRKSGDAIE